MKSGDGITSENIFELGDYPVYGGNGLRGFTSIFTHEGDFTLIGRQGALCGNITRVRGKFYASEHAVVVTPEDNVELDWLSQKLFSMNLNQYSEATAQPGLSIFKILPLFAETPFFKEQQGIAERLKAIDNKLQTEQTYLQKMQLLKKGLMEDLLSGRKQVKVAEELVLQGEN
jgi:type I restriction enzyme S subunit